MNIFALIQGFGNYLEGLNKITGKDYNMQGGNASIFNFSSEFKDYLSSEYGADASIFSFNVSDLMNLEISNGQIVNPSDENEENSNPLVDILNKLFQNESAKSAIDKDGNGDLSQEEINIFLQSISNVDGNIEDISVDDVFSAIQGLENAEGTVGDNETVESAQAAEETKKTKKSHHHHHSSKDNNINSDNGDKQKSLDTMSKAELATELSNASSDVKTKQEKLDSILNGSDSNLKSLKEAENEAYETYQTKLSEVDKELAEKVNTLKQSIDAKEAEIDAKESEVIKQKNTVSDCKSDYDNAVSSRQNLESILSELKSTDTSNMDAESKAANQEKINNAEAKLQQAKEKETQTKTAWDNAKTQLTTLEGERDELKTGENGLSKLQEQMSALENEVNTKHPEVSELLKAYNDAKTATNNYKESAISTAKTELQTSKDYEIKVKSAYQDAENEEDTENLSPIMYNKETAEKIAALAKKYANKMDTIGNCLVGVARAIREFLGLKHTALSPLPKAYLAAEQFRNDPTLSKHFKEVKVDRSDLANLPAGAVVVWNKSEGHPAGHISIALGNGKEASDHIQKQMNRQNADFTVFYPV